MAPSIQLYTQLIQLYIQLYIIQLLYKCYTTAIQLLYGDTGIGIAGGDGDGGDAASSRARSWENRRSEAKSAPRTAMLCCTPLFFSPDSPPLLNATQAG
jgi:hypothetical protein